MNKHPISKTFAARILILTDVNKPLPSILIIEPDRRTLELYERALAQDFQVFGAIDEKQALFILGQKKLDAVVLEPAGLGGRGWSLLTSIKSISNLQGIPVILCTILDQRQRGIEMGAAVYLTKPVLPTALQQVLHKILSIT